MHDGFWSTPVEIGQCDRIDPPDHPCHLPPAPSWWFTSPIPKKNLPLLPFQAETSTVPLAD